jgi:hypothetical protein
MGDGPDTRSREEMNLYEFRMRRKDGTEFVAETRETVS